MIKWIDAKQNNGSLGGTPVRVYTLWLIDGRPADGQIFWAGPGRGKSLTKSQPESRCELLKFEQWNNEI